MEEIELVLATQEQATIVHELQYKAFWPLYEKYRDEETNPVKETLMRTQEKITGDNSDFYMIKVDGNAVGGVCVRRKKHYVIGNNAMDAANHAADQAANHAADHAADHVADHATHFADVTMISPLFVLTEYQNQGIGQKVLHMIFDQYPDTIRWRLDTIKQEKGNCHLYEKCGFVQTGNEKVINDKMTLIMYEKSMACARRFHENDAEAVRNLMCRNFREVNVKDYGERAMESFVESYKADKVIQIAKNAHMYVFEWWGQIVGVGSISSYWGSLKESILLTIFVLPELHEKGIGRHIIHTLEGDELFLRADRIEIPASITATEFYRKCGYDYKDNIKEMDQEGHYRLEKFRTGMKCKGSVENTHL